MFKAQRFLVVCMAVVGLMVTSACSRSGGGGANPQHEHDHQAAGTPGSQSELDADSGKSAQDDKGPQNGAQSPQNSSRNSPQNSPQNAPQNPHRNAPQNSNGPRISNDRDPSEGGPQSSQSPQAPQGPQVVTYDPTGMTPSQIFNASQKQGPAFVGNESDVANGESAEPLYFSGSGQDDLRLQMQTEVDAKTKAARVQRDKAFAKTVSKGRFDVDWSTRTAILDVTLKGVNGREVHRFSGSLDNKLLLRAGDLRHGQHISVEAACMDLNGGCNTVYAKIQDGSGGIVRTAHMLIRQTEATLFTHADGFGLAQNDEFDSLLRTLVRTDHHAGELDALNKLTLRTSETINGESSFKVEMGIRSADNFQESLNFDGPLVKPAGDIYLNARAQVLGSSSPAGDTIRNVDLVANDGRGTLTLAITVRKAGANAQEDTLDITVARIHKPVRGLVIE